MKELLKKILRAMDVEAQEAGLVFLLLSQSVFLGIFYGAFDPAANSLFLGVFPASMLPNAFIVSGLAGILMTSIYSYLQSRIPFSRLAILNLATIVLITFFLWLGFNMTDSKWHVFIVLVMMGPLNIISMIGFWGTAGRLFTLRQGKRLFGLVDAGQIIGIILSSYAIPVLLSFHFKTKDLLLISSISAGTALVFQLITTFNNSNLRQKVEKKEEKVSNTSLVSLLKNPFVRLMAIFVSLSMIAAFFISFSFLAVTKIKYPDTSDFAKFLGAFVGTVMFFTLMIKLFVYGKFMKTYGLRTSLILSPVLLILLTIAASLIGIFGGYTAVAGGFVFFFLIIALSRLFSVTLKSSIEAPSFKVLYQTIEAHIRHHVQARVEGNVNELSALFSGLLLLILGSLSFFKLINFTEVLFLILVCWAFVAYRLYKAYKTNLDESLVQIKIGEHVIEAKSFTGIASCLGGNETASKVLYVMNLQEKVQPIVYENLLPFLLHHKQSLIRQYALNRSNALNVYDVLDTLKGFQDENLDNLSKQLSKKLTDELAEGFLSERILTLTRSKDPNEREKAARLIGESKNKEFVQQIKFLLRDFNDKVKIAAIKASSKLKNNELAPLLAEFLTVDIFNRFAFDALVETGEEAIDCLEHIFNKSGNETVLLLRIIRIIGEIGGNSASHSLITKVNYHDIEVARLSAKMLLALNYKVDENNFYLVHQSLMQAMGIEAWNIAARASLQEANADKLLKDALNEEIFHGFEHIFTLLSLAYDAKSISHIKQNIESESSESIGYAIELLELLIAEDFKPILFPLIDDSSDNEKIKLLQIYYPVDITPLNELLIDIINRDFNQIGKWTKACALKCLFSIENFEVTDDLVAQLFNPDELLSELTVCLIFKNDNEKLEKCFKRLDEKTKSRLRVSLENFKNSESKLLINKILFLKSVDYFKALAGDKLIRLSKLLKDSVFNEGDDIESIDTDFAIIVYMLVSGQVEVGNENGIIARLKPGSIFGGVFSQHYPNSLPVFTASGNVFVYSINQDLFDTVVFDYPEYAESLVLYSPIEPQ